MSAMNLQLSQYIAYLSRKDLKIFFTIIMICKYTLRAEIER